MTNWHSLSQYLTQIAKDRVGTILANLVLVAYCCQPNTKLKHNSKKGIFMGKSKEQIVEEITNYLIKCGIQTWDEVYVGIAKDPKDRLFNGHKVKEKGGIWIYRLANSSDCAREVEKYLLNKGAAGGPGGGDDDTIYVYAYKKESYTIDG